MVGTGQVLRAGEQALKKFVSSSIRALVVTFHQPLFGVGANDKGMPIVRAIAAGIHLPVRVVQLHRRARHRSPAGSTTAPTVSR